MYLLYFQLFLTSPQGTKSTLLQKRPRDSSKDGFKKWSFLTVHSWGEMAMGTWKLEIKTTYTTGIFVQHVLVVACNILNK